MEAKKLLKEVMVELNCDEMFDIEGGKKRNDDAISNLFGAAMGLIFPGLDCVTGAKIAFGSDSDDSDSDSQIGYGCTRR